MLHQILLLFDLLRFRGLAQVGTFLTGVAVASSILCISTTLNKRKISLYEIESKTKIHLYGVPVNTGFSSDLQFKFLQLPLGGHQINLCAKTLQLQVEVLITALNILNIIHCADPVSRKSGNDQGSARP